MKNYEIATKNFESWIHPHNSFLHVKEKMLKSDGSTGLARKK